LELLRRIFFQVQRPSASDSLRSLLSVFPLQLKLRKKGKAEERSIAVAMVSDDNAAIGKIDKQ